MQIYIQAKNKTLKFFQGLNVLFDVFNKGGSTFFIVNALRDYYFHLFQWAFILINYLEL